MMIGLGMILLGIILGIITMFAGVLYIPFGMVFGALTSMKWAKELFDGIGFNVSNLYLWFAAGMVVCFILSKMDDRGFGVTPASFAGGIYIASLFVVTGLAVIPSTAGFVANVIFPFIEHWTYMIAVVLVIGLLPVLIFLTILW